MTKKERTLWNPQVPSPVTSCPYMDEIHLEFFISEFKLYIGLG